MDRKPPGAGAATSPQTGYRDHRLPTALDPRFHPQTVHRADTMFMPQSLNQPPERPHRPSMSTTASHNSLSAQLYPAHLQAFSQPAHPAPPPVTQRPPYLAQSPYQGLVRPSRVQTVPNPFSHPSGPVPHGISQPQASQIVQPAFQPHERPPSVDHYASHSTDPLFHQQQQQRPPHNDQQSHFVNGQAPHPITHAHPPVFQPSARPSTPPHPANPFPLPQSSPEPRQGHEYLNSSPVPSQMSLPSHDGVYPSPGQHHRPLEPTFDDAPPNQSPHQIEPSHFRASFDDDELARVLALSQSENRERQILREQLQKQEEEDLARAMAESMLSTASDLYSTSNPFFVDPIKSGTSSKFTLDNPVFSESSNGRHTVPNDTWNPSGVGLSADETLTEAPFAKGKNAHSQPNASSNYLPEGLKSSYPDTVNHDEPRREERPFLVEEEPEKVYTRKRVDESDLHGREGSAESSPKLDTLDPIPVQGTNLESYEASDLPPSFSQATAEGSTYRPSQSPSIPSSSQTNTKLPQSSSSENPASPSELAYYNDDEGPSVSSPAATWSNPDFSSSAHPVPVTSSQTSPDSFPQRQRSASAPYNPQATSSAVGQTFPAPMSSPTASIVGGFGAPSNTLPPLSRMTSHFSSEDNNTTSSPMTPVNPNSYIDQELLIGVSIGFTQPSLSLLLKPMEGAVPNIISLPYGRCPGLHVHAPSWKHMLRLMARMSSTKFEPTVSAMAITKTDLKLRTVIQFIKPSPSAQEWRTILWFKIDHPVPPNHPNTQKYATHNPNLLPYSFTLMTLPLVLQNAADSPISKTYTVPATEQLPYPTLPINFPNLAVYLQAVLNFSREQKDDGNNGYRKLAKMVASCYPNYEENSSLEPPEKTKVSDLFKRVIGRNNRKQKGKSNNETYELITPFVPDEWG